MGTWEEPEGFEHSGGHLSKEEIQVLVYLHCFYFRLNEWIEWYI